MPGVTVCVWLAPAPEYLVTVDALPSMFLRVCVYFLISAAVALRPRVSWIIELTSSLADSGVYLVTLVTVDGPPDPVPVPPSAIVSCRNSSRPIGRTVLIDRRSSSALVKAFCKAGVYLSVILPL
jgi:hypothetical protein